MSNTEKVKKVYSLSVDGVEILSVEVETIDGLPPVKLNKEWLRNLAQRQLNHTLNGNSNGNGKPARRRTVKPCQERELNSQHLVPKTSASA